MTESYPVPPPELVEQWRTQPEFAELGRTTGVSMTQSRLRDIAAQAARWGSDQELEACCSEMDGWGDIHYSAGWKFSKNLRNARRPKPPSLKEQALEQLEEISSCFRVSHGGDIVCDKIRAAIEQLPDAL